MHKIDLPPKNRNTKSGKIAAQGTRLDTPNCRSYFYAGTTSCNHAMVNDTHTTLNLALGGYNWENSSLGKYLGSNTCYLGEFVDFDKGSKNFTVRAHGSEELRHILAGLKFMVARLEEDMATNTKSCNCSYDKIAAAIDVENSFDEEAGPLIAKDVAERGR
jgi:hypothetical protein